MATSHETILLPALQLAGKFKTLSLIQAVSILASQHPLAQSSTENLRDPSAPAFRTVASAFYYLKSADLLEIDPTGLWSVTDAGRQVIASPIESIDIAFLETIPAYIAYKDRVKTETVRRQFLALRFDYYTSGRLLFINGSTHAAATLLAYSIEYHLKAAMAEVEDSWTINEKRIMQRSHSLKLLYRACLDLGLLNNSYISFDFLDYAYDHFERRYPSGEGDLLQNRGYWHFGGSLLSTYDDCILQLDNALAQLYGTTKFTLGSHAISGALVSPELGDAFFHNNVFALEHLPAYVASCSGEWLLHFDTETLNRPELLFSRERLPHPGVTLKRAQDLLRCNLAAFFRYPKVGQPDPDPARLLFARKDRLPFGIHYSRWVIERMVKEFGPESVEIIEDKNYPRVLLYVFDRKAKNWWRTLTLREGFIENFVPNSDSRRALEEWIEQTKQQFKSLRSNLRVPPKKTLRTRQASPPRAVKPGPGDSKQQAAAFSDPSEDF